VTQRLCIYPGCKRSTEPTVPYWRVCSDRNHHAWLHVMVEPELHFYDTPPELKLMTDQGYVIVRLAVDDWRLPMARGNRRWVLEHRAVMAESIGRLLMRQETVHHRNGIRTDNRIENLELWARSHPPGQRLSDLFHPGIWPL